MNILILFGLFALLGFTAGAPEPQQQYRESLHPYYYGYPQKTAYVYRPSLEDDDEEVAPTMVQHERSKMHGKKQVGRERATNVGETGYTSPDSKAQAENQPGDSPPSKVANKPLTTVIKAGVVHPPAFPPKRPEPTAKPEKEKEKVTDEDEDEDDEDDEGDSQDEEDEDEEDEEDEEERRRTALKETLALQDVNVNSTVTVVPVNQTGVANETTVVTKNKKNKPVKATTVDKKKNKNKVVAVEDASDENVSAGGVEALVPGYVTDQGEVLVPVDTVTGDQPVSIIPDPYSPPARGVPLRNNYLFNSIPTSTYNTVPTLPGQLSFRQGEVFGADDDDDVTLEDEEGDDAGDNEDADDEDEEDEEDEGEKKSSKKTPAPKQPPKKVPLGLIPASAPTNEDDELEAGKRYRSAAAAVYYGSVDGRRFPPSRSPTLYPITFQFNGGYLTGPFNEPMESAEVSQYIQRQPQTPLVNRRVVPQRRPLPVVQRRPVVAPVSYNTNPFYSYYGNNGPQYSSVEQTVVRRRPAYQPRPAYYSPAVTGFSPYAQSPYTNQVRLYTRRPYQTPKPVTYSPNARPFNVEQYLPAKKTLTKLRNPGDRLKISSSYELLVEPPNFNRVRTKPRRPNNKKRVVLKRPASAQLYQQRPVQVVPFARPPPQQLQQQAPVFYRPVYNVEPHQRVSVSGAFYRPNQVPVVPTQQHVSYQSPNVYNGYREFIKGLLSGYYGNNVRPVGFNRPTPVIKMKNDLATFTSSSASAEDDSSASSSASSEITVQQTPSSTSETVKSSRAERNSRKSRLDQDKKKKTKKVKKSKKVRDPLNILKKINSKSNM